MASLLRSAGALIAFVPLLTAQETPPPEQPPEREFAWETGKVQTAGGYATITLPDGWRYLQPADARYVVEKLWGNPPDPDTIGLAVPPGESDWAVIVSYEDTGHVEDDDAAGLDYAELLTQMQQDTKESNAARRKAGYATAELIGWAEPPHYDSAAKKLYWAKRLQFSDAEQQTLNYDVRVLAAGGVLVMRAVADVSDLPAVTAGIQQLLPATELSQGHRYGDFDASIHKVAAYGIGGLIAGKLLVKAGLLKVLLKPLLIGLAVLGGVLYKLLGRKRQAAAQA